MIRAFGRPLNATAIVKQRSPEKSPCLVSHLPSFSF
jgi:hypothetical protein